MSGIHFGATVETVLAKVQNTSADASVIGLDIEDEMQASYARIVKKMPDKMSDPINLGEIRGHILVDSANDGQTDIDISQKVYSFASNWHIFLNPGCNGTISNVSDEMELGVDYTIPVAGGKPAFTALAKASHVVANYHTTWVDNDGLEDLRSMLEEDVAIIILYALGVANNPNLLENANIRRKDWKETVKEMQLGEATPMGLQAIKLVNEVSTNDESNNATISRFKRG